MSRFLSRGAGLAIGSAVFLFFAPLLESHDPITTKLTWTQEISRIVYKRCADCHRAGGSAFSLVNYDEARPWAKAIRDEVLSRRMPPWGPVKGIGDFAHDPSLSQPEIDMLVTWVEGGAPEGDAAYLPQYAPTRHPPPVKAVPIPHIDVRRELILRQRARLQAIRPDGLKDGGELEAWAVKPDGSVERLIWIKDFQAKFVQSYVLSQPMALPAGTRLHVSGDGSATFYLN